MWCLTYPKTPIEYGKFVMTDKWKPTDVSWKLKHKNAVGRLYRWIDKNLSISRNHLKRLRKGKFKPGGTVIDFDEWYKD